MIRRVVDALFVASVTAALVLAAVIIYGNVTDPAVCWTTC